MSSGACRSRASRCEYRARDPRTPFVDCRQNGCITPRGCLATRCNDRLTEVARSLFEKIWEAHVVRAAEGEPTLLYVDLHLVHEVTSAQAFDGLRLAGRSVRRPDLTVATMDHNVPTLPGPIEDPLARAQLDALRRNCEEFGIRLYETGSGREGIVHVIGPELGVTQPG